MDWSGGGGAVVLIFLLQWGYRLSAMEISRPGAGSLKLVGLPGLAWRLVFPVSSGYFCFQFLDAGLGCVALGFSSVGPGPFVIECGYVLSGGRVVPPQLSLFPLDEEVERGAVALQHTISYCFYWNRLVPVLYQPVCCPG